VFFLNHEKKLVKIRAVIFEKNVKSTELRCTPFQKSDVTEPKATLKLVKVMQFQQPFSSMMNLFLNNFVANVYCN